MHTTSPSSPPATRRGPRHVGRLALVVLAAGVALAGCSGSSDRRLTQTVGDSTAPGQPAPAGGAAAAAPASTPPPTPAKQVSPECGALNTFQLINFAVGSNDVPKEKDKKDEAVRTLEATGANAAGKIPELQSSIKMIILSHKARFDGAPTPEPSGGDPTVKDAGDKLGAWAKDHDC